MSLEDRVIDLGKMSYAEAWEKQKYFFRQRQAENIGDTLLLVEHPPTISLGKAQDWNKMHVSPDELKGMGIAFHRSERGGGAAYLGPGQLVGYTIMNIAPYQGPGKVLPFMQKLEELMIRTARDFGIKVGRYDVKNPTTDKPYRATWYLKDGEPHVLCTKGIKYQLRGNNLYTHHGFALNVNRGESSYFHLIDPCGFPLDEVKPISMEEILGRRVDMMKVKESVRQNFFEIFNKPSKNSKEVELAQ